MEMSVECLDCQKRFRFEESLVVHHTVCMKHQEHNTRPRVSCEQCGKSFKNLTSLRNHARTHTDYFNITKEEFDRSLRSSLDISNNILESTRTSEADTSIMANRSLDISAVTCSDSLVYSTYVCNDDITNTTLTDEPVDVATTFTKDKPSNETYVFDKATTDTGVDNGDVIGLDRTYVCDGERRLSPDRTYLVQQQTEADLTITDETGELPMDATRVISGHVTSDLPSDTTRVISDYVTSDLPNDVTHVVHNPIVSRRSSGIPVPSHSSRQDWNRNTKTSPLKTDSPRGITRPSRSVSIKSIRTLRNGRSKSRTPVKTNKRIGTPGKHPRSKSRSRTPTTGRSSKYAVRFPSGMNYSPFKLTPLSPKLTPLSKKNTLGVATFKCNKCGKAFNDKDQLDIHYVIHVRDTPVKCGIPSECYKKNSRKLQFSTPERKAESIKITKPSFVCPHCQRAYQTERYLVSHMKIHFIDVPFVCTKCDKRFKYAQSLRAHAMTHIGEEANGTNKTNGVNTTKCNERISRNFTEELENMKDSQKQFANVKDDAAMRDLLDLPYTCNSCPYKTSEPTSLLKHMHTHSKARPYKCTECDKSYKTKSNLELHGKAHMIGKIRTLLTDRRNSVLSGRSVAF